MRSIALTGLALVLALAAATVASADSATTRREVVIVGTDNDAIQAAIDQVAANGGGEVVIPAGEYLCHNSVRLRDNVTLRGEGRVVLRKNDGIRRPLIADCGFYYDRVRVTDPSEWRVGWGITIQARPENAGFFDNVRTIAAIEGNDLVLDESVDGSDYTVGGGAIVQNTFPLIAGYNCRNATVENIICEGNKENNPLLNGCRGGAIFLFKSQHCAIRNCVATDFNGDGISWQVSPYTTVTGCTIFGNTGLGLHPGSGSHHTTIANCRSYDNGGVGMFLCWRVAHSRFERNHVYSNADCGVSIGNNDTDNLFVGNTIEGNARSGVYFRPIPAHIAGHRCTFEGNTIRNNGGPQDAGVWIDGETAGTRLIANTISDDRGSNAAAYGVYIGKDASDVVVRGNVISGFATEIRDDSAPGKVTVE